MWGGGDGVPQLQENRSSWAWDPSRPHLMCPFVWLFICIFYNNRTGKDSIFLSSVTCSSSLSRLRGGFAGTPELEAKSDESVGNLGTQYLRLASEVGDSLVGWSPKTCGVWCQLQVARVCIELNCRTIIGIGELEKWSM